MNFVDDADNKTDCAVLVILFCISRPLMISQRLDANFGICQFQLNISLSIPLYGCFLTYFALFMPILKIKIEMILMVKLNKK